MPSSTGLSVTALSLRPISPGLGGERSAFTGDTQERHAVDEPPRPLANGHEAVVGRGGRGEQHGLDLVRVGGVGPTVELVERQVGHDPGGDARRRGARRRTPVAHVPDGVGVGHHHERDVHVERADVVDHARGRGPGGRRGRAATLPGWSGRPSPGRRRGSRSRWRRRPPRPPPAPRRARPSRARRSRRAPGAWAPVSRRARRCSSRVTRAAHPLRRSAIHAACLTPRPDRVTSTVDPAGTARPPRGRASLSHAPARAGHDALGHRQELESGDRFVVGGELVLGAAVAASCACQGPPPGSRARH